MQFMQSIRAAALTLSAALTVCSFASAQHNTFPGQLGSGGSSTPVNWVYDTGADVTLAPGAVLAAAGFVVPNGFIMLNGALAACFANVPVGCVDSAGNLCTGTTTVYAFVGPNPIGGMCLLGRDIRKQWDGTWKDSTETVTWGNPGPLPPLAAVLGYRADSQTGVFHDVVDAVRLTAGAQTTLNDMTVLTNSNRSFVPLSVALQLNPVIVGVVDLLATDFDSLLAIYTAQQNQTIQTVFFEVEIDSALLPIGPDSGRVRVLVSDDRNSDFGVIGKDLLVSEPGMTFGRHDWRRATYLSYGFDGVVNSDS